MLFRSRWFRSVRRDVNKSKLTKENSNLTSSLPSVSKSINKIQKITSHDFNLNELPHSNQLLNLKDKFDNRRFYRMKYDLSRPFMSKWDIYLEQRSNHITFLVGYVIKTFINS